MRKIFAYSFFIIGMVSLCIVSIAIIIVLEINRFLGFIISPFKKKKK